MLGFPHELRIRLSEDIPKDGQIAVMGRIPCFDGAEIYNIAKDIPPTKKCLKCAVLNMEHGKRNRELLPFLMTNEHLKDVDILFANELDDGTFRSGNIDSAKAIAEGMGFNYACGLEFIELRDSRDEKGYESNAVLSRYPIVRAASVHLPIEFDWYYSEQSRIGVRNAVFAELDLGDRFIGAICTHLENRATPEGRANQVREIAERAKLFFGDLPVVMGGDFNFNTFYSMDEKQSLQYVEEINSGKYRNVDEYEPSLKLLKEYGFNYSDFNGQYLPTRRCVLFGKKTWLHIDWIFGKNCKCLEHGMVSTLTEECKKWAPDDSPIQSYDGEQLSDHNAVWAVFR